MLPDDISICRPLSQLFLPPGMSASQQYPAPTADRHKNAPSRPDPCDRFQKRVLMTISKSVSHLTVPCLHYHPIDVFTDAVDSAALPNLCGAAKSLVSPTRSPPWSVNWTSQIRRSSLSLVGNPQFVDVPCAYTFIASLRTTV